MYDFSCADCTSKAFQDLNLPNAFDYKILQLSVQKKLHFLFNSSIEHLSRMVLFFCAIKFFRDIFVFFFTMRQRS